MIYKEREQTEKEKILPLSSQVPYPRFFTGKRKGWGRLQKTKKIRQKKEKYRHNKSSITLLLHQTIDN